jgi:hypothetical protein
MGLLINVAIQSIDNNQMLNDFSQSMPSSRKIPLHSISQNQNCA